MIVKIQLIFQYIQQVNCAVSKPQYQRPHSTHLSQSHIVVHQIPVVILFSSLIYPFSCNTTRGRVVQPFRPRTRRRVSCRCLQELCKVKSEGRRCGRGKNRICFVRLPTKIQLGCRQGCNKQIHLPSSELQHTVQRLLRTSPAWLSGTSTF